MKKKIIILGAGGHAKSCIDIIEAENKYKIIGLLDQNKKKGFKVSKYSVLGSDSYLKEVRIITNVAFLAVGHIKNSEAREKLYFKAKKMGFYFPKIISPHSIISPYSKIGEGSLIAHGVKINSNSSVGHNCIINTNANIEHDVKIGNFCHISTSVTVNGEVKIGNRCFVGSGSIIKNLVKIKDNTFLPMCSVLKKDI